MPPRKTEPVKEVKRQGAYIGIDPGANGGLVCLFDDKTFIQMMPETERDIWDWFNQWKGVPVFGIIEKVGGFMGGTGRNVASGHTMFNFGLSYGVLRMAFIAAEIPFEEVPPRTWQKGLKIPPMSRTESKTEFKNRLKGLAQQLFPLEKVTLATSDALLIAEYCRRKREGCL